MARVNEWGLNDRQVNFAETYHLTKDAAASYLTAYPKSNPSCVSGAVSKILSNKKVKVFLQHLEDKDRVIQAMVVKENKDAILESIKSFEKVSHQMVRVLQAKLPNPEDPGITKYSENRFKQLTSSAKDILSIFSGIADLRMSFAGLEAIQDEISRRMASGEWVTIDSEPSPINEMVEGEGGEPPNTINQH